MTTFKPRKCGDCDNLFTPSGPAAKYCPDHAESRKREAACRNVQRYRIKHGLVQKPGVGKGGNNAKGEEDSQFKTGIMYFQRIRGVIRKERRYCEECGKDLINASRFEWAVHHIDHDRTNNHDSNFQLLCKRCHQIHHECHANFNVQRLTPEGV